MDESIFTTHPVLALYREKIGVLIDRMARGGYRMLRVSTVTLDNRVLISIRFWSALDENEKEIHVTGTDPLALFNAALAEAHRRYREAHAPRVPSRAEDPDFPRHGHEP